MEKKNEEKKVTCILDEEQEYLEIKIIKIFESYLERVFNGILN